MKVAVLGLGEAGSVLAADLAHSGDEVHGYDPRPVPVPPGVQRHDTSQAAVAGCALVLAVVAASQADDALAQVLESLESGAIYADLSTASPGLKEALADKAAGRTAKFADVALMAPVPGRGLTAPALASGSGAAQYAKLINARGGQVDVVGERAGQAAARKLLRSVVMKGLAALLIESTEAATRYGQGEWFWNHLVDQLGSIDEALMERLLFATASHALRRLEEMEAARELLVELGIPPLMTTATITHLRRLVAEGMPQVHRQSSINPTDA
jgi:3-hydroxyisobutyrate dehydrogenase-like beta-hydroxyacid dehydrogenase